MEIKNEVEDTHNPFEDSKEKFKDAIVNLKEDKGGGRVFLSRKPISLSKKL